MYKIYSWESGDMPILIIWVNWRFQIITLIEIYDAVSSLDPVILSVRLTVCDCTITIIFIISWGQSLNSQGSIKF